MVLTWYCNHAKHYYPAQATMHEFRHKKTKCDGWVQHLWRVTWESLKIYMLLFPAHHTCTQLFIEWEYSVNQSDAVSTFEPLYEDLWKLNIVSFHKTSNHIFKIIRVDVTFHNSTIEIQFTTDPNTQILLLTVLDKNIWRRGLLLKGI